MDEQLTNGANQLLNYGALGIFCLFLIIALYIFWAFLQKILREFIKRVDRFTDVSEKFAVNNVKLSEAVKSLRDVIHAAKNV